MNSNAAGFATCASLPPQPQPGTTTVYGEYCEDYGHECPDYQRCCGQTCCIPTDLEDHYHAHLRWSIWNMWYFWFVVLFVLMSCFGGCSYYRRHQLLMARQQSMMGSAENGYSSWRFPPAFPVSLFTGYGRGGGAVVRQPGAEMSAGAAAFPTPPPYAEVMSQPDAYPPHKDQDLPPYPGLTAVYTDGTPLPPYASAIPQLPPYSPRETDNTTAATPQTTATNAASSTQTLLPPGERSSQPVNAGGAASGIPRSNVVLLPPENTAETQH